MTVAGVVSMSRFCFELASVKSHYFINYCFDFPKVFSLIDYIDFVSTESDGEMLSLLLRAG